MNSDRTADDLRARILRREVLIGTFLNMGSPIAAEACALAGYDWLLADLEHGSGGEDALLGQLLAAAAHQVPVIVRVETADRIRAGRALDLGAAGVMFPRLDTAEQVRHALAHLRYPPDGDRGVATYNRACRFGRSPGELAKAGDRVTGIVQVESVSALDELEQIATTPGVDALFVGPRDLSHALGVPGQLDHPAFTSALSRVLDIGTRAGVATGLLAGTPDGAARYVEDGFTFVAVSSDSSTLAAAAAAAVSSLRSGSGQ
jgi:2-keto-3-deoxy-L-rhamnonate aldolase RhmA